VVLGATLGATLGARAAWAGGADPPSAIAAAAAAAAADTVAVPAPVAAPPAFRRVLDGAFRPDRIAHASVALAIGAGVGLASREPAAGAAGALSLAVAKELLDDRFDRGDLIAGTVGAALALAMVAALTR
jgi:hypothetical protein